MNSVIEILKSKTYQIKEELLFNYKKLNITDSEFIVLIYLMNTSNIYNPKELGESLNIELNNVLELINSLCEKNIIEIKIEKINGVRTEIINLTPFYEKIVLSLDTKKDNDKSNSNIFSLFEEEFGRTLSPMEYEIINAWIDSGCSEELIILALKEATYNGVSNLRYIDKIIYEWGKKGIKTKEDVEKDRKKFKNNSKKKELFDYDLLNDEDSNSLYE